MRSVLNERLRATIELNLAEDEYPSDIKVQLASPEQFDKAGLAWNYFVSGIKLNVKAGGKGRALVNLSSSDVLKEPVLDLLLEVSWPKGKTYREFTILVDPPAAYRPSAPVQSEPATVTYQPDLERQSVRKGSADASRVVVRPNQTLWGVAEQVRPEGASVEQTLMAIFNDNPAAFYRNNVNALKAGAQLAIPSRASILQRTQRQALAEFRQQNQAWRGQVVKSAAAVEAELEAPLKPERESLKLAAPEQVTTPGQPDSNLQTDATGPLGDEELRDRIVKLEQQLAVMQQVLALKDEQLARLQQTNDLPAETAIPPSQAAPEVESEALPELEDESAQAPEGQFPEPEREEPEASVPPSVPTTEQEVRPAPQLQPSPAPRVTPPISEPESGFDWLIPVLGVTALSLLTGLGLVWWRKRKSEEDPYDLESIFAASSQIELPDDDKKPSDQISSVASPESSGAYNVGTVGESSFMSDFTGSDLETFDAGQHEIDPISEADVYLAYGRYQQAEDLIRQAIQDSPDKDKFKLKLLEIFYANENHEGFLEYAGILLEAGKNQDSAFWAKVVEMGEEVAPGSELFGMAEPTQVKITGSASSVPTSSDQESIFEGNEVPPDHDQHSLDMNGGLELDSDQVTENAKAQDLSFESEFNDHAIKHEQESQESLDFDLGDFTLPVAESGSAQQQDSQPEIDDDHAIDFDPGTLSLDEFSAEHTQAPDDQDIESWELPEVSFGEQDSSLGANQERSGDKASKEGFEDLSLTDFSDLELESLQSMTDDNDTSGHNFSLDSLDTEVSDLTDMDEFETKVDLARAYVDMGDIEAAKAIAEEVMAKGNPEQQKQAKAILEQLD